MITAAQKIEAPRIYQGDIFREVEYIESVTEVDEVISISKITFPLVIVLTQECDLEQNYHTLLPEKQSKSESPHDKWLFSILVAPLYNAEHVYNGEHLSALSLTMGKIKKSKTEGRWLRSNDRPRYHYLEFPSEFQIPNSIIDFKHYFSVNLSYLQEIRKTNYVCSVSNLYREDISQRFANFLSRIGLPNPDVNYGE